MSTAHRHKRVGGSTQPKYPFITDKSWYRLVQSVLASIYHEWAADAVVGYVKHCRIDPIDATNSVAVAIRVAIGFQHIHNGIIAQIEVVSKRNFFA